MNLMKNSIKSILLLASLMSILTACGGGSNSDTSSASTAAASSGGTSTASVVDSTCGFANFQAEMLARINAYRAAGAVCGGTSFPAAAAMSWNGQLQSAATVMASDIAKTGSHSHIGSDGSTFGSRIAAAGYAYSYAGENIGGGYGSVQQQVDGWIASPTHCEISAVGSALRNR